jgi:hypothetical protein
MGFQEGGLPASPGAEEQKTRSWWLKPSLKHKVKNSMDIFKINFNSKLMYSALSDSPKF